MAASAGVNTLLSDSKSSDSRLQVQLHPLVILTISDYITRHILRQQQGPIVGAILGSQHGRDITMEHAFECKLEAGQGSDVVVDASWFESRLQQFKDVHKAAALDFVGWFTLASVAGPEAHHLPIHQQFLHTYNESTLLLLFHPSAVADGTSKGGKLPLAIYESVYESVTSDDGDRQMSGGEGPQHSLRFQELPYTIETGEAEMISVDFVARGGANATAIEEPKPDSANSPTPAKDTKGKGKAPASNKNGIQTNGTKPNLILSAEDEDHIALLTAKSNAIRMLQQRIALLRSYLHALPPCYLTHNAQRTNPAALHAISPNLNLDHQILRQTSALLARLPLLSATSSPSHSDLTIPSQNPSPIPAQETYTSQSLRQSSDVALTSLLSSLGTTLSSTQRMGRKFAIFENGRTSKESLSGRVGAFGEVTPRGFSDYNGGEGMGEEGEWRDEMET